MNSSESAGRSLYIAVERVARALRHQRQAFATTHALTLLQVSVLDALSVRDHRVGDLGAELEVTQPTVSDAVSALESKGLVTKVRNTTDARIVHVSLSNEGKRIIDRLPLPATAVDRGEQNRGALLEGLLQEMQALSAAGLLAANHSCFTCRFLEEDTSGRRCGLLDVDLEPSALRADCPEHEPLEPS